MSSTAAIATSIGTASVTPPGNVQVTGPPPDQTRGPSATSATYSDVGKPGTGVMTVIATAGVTTLSGTSWTVPSPSASFTCTG